MPTVDKFLGALFEQLSLGKDEKKVANLQSGETVYFNIEEILHVVFTSHHEYLYLSYVKGIIEIELLRTEIIPNNDKLLGFIPSFNPTFDHHYWFRVSPSELGKVNSNCQYHAGTIYLSNEKKEHVHSFVMSVNVPTDASVEALKKECDHLKCQENDLIFCLAQSIGIDRFVDEYNGIIIKPDHDEFITFEDKQEKMLIELPDPFYILPNKIHLNRGWRAHLDYVNSVWKAESPYYREKIRCKEISPRYVNNQKIQRFIVTNEVWLAVGSPCVLGTIKFEYLQQEKQIEVVKLNFLLMKQRKPVVIVNNGQEISVVESKKQQVKIEDISTAVFEKGVRTFPALPINKFKTYIEKPLDDSKYCKKNSPQYSVRYSQDRVVVRDPHCHGESIVLYPFASDLLEIHFTLDCNAWRIISRTVGVEILRYFEVGGESVFLISIRIQPTVGHFASGQVTFRCSERQVEVVFNCIGNKDDRSKRIETDNKSNCKS